MANRLIDDFGGLLVDLDGVVYIGGHAIPGASEALERLSGEGKGLAYVTNNASRSTDEIASQLNSLGAPANAGQIYGSAQAGAELLAREVPLGGSVLVAGSQALAYAVRARGFVVVASADDRPDAVIQGFSPALGWKDLAEVAYAVAGGSTWIATNTDMSLPQERGFAPGNGTLVAAVTSATGKYPLVAGKPEATLFELAAHDSGVNPALVVGDRLDTDILGGNRAAMATALVLTGVDTVRTALAAIPDERPDFLLESLAQIYEEYPAVVADAGSYSCGGAVAQVSGASVNVRGREDDLDAWRAACAAWWAVPPNEASKLDPEISFSSAH